MTEGELVRRAQAGDRGAAAELLLGHQAGLRAYLARHLGSVHDAHDVLQDTFFDALSGLRGFDPARPFGPWILAICRNRLLNLRRAGRARGGEWLAGVERAIEERRPDAGAGHGPDALRALRSCMAELQEKSREMVRLRYDGGASVQDLAARFGLTVGGVTKTLSRIRAGLKDCLARRMEAVS
ncbi:MAG TPA: sigma-70 family RNA polymerase sigma factor [Planctomycetota bacterium]|nr:sigma-70 family RNA polymerase sigma factor [Planctomycetota bacterium]